MQGGTENVKDEINYGQAIVTNYSVEEIIDILNKLWIENNTLKNKIQILQDIRFLLWFRLIRILFL